MKLIFLGPPGAGKGTQSEFICRDYGIKQISTGDLLRYHRKEGTDLGKKAKLYMDKGELVPDSLIIDMIKEELTKPEYSNGYLLDGFPRTLPQAEALDRLLRNLSQKLNAVLILDVPQDELIKRITERRICKICGKVYHLIYSPPKQNGICDLDGGELYQRSDDNEETVTRRLIVFENQTKPLIDYYHKHGLAYKILGVGKIDEIYKRIKEVLDSITLKLKN